MFVRRGGVPRAGHRGRRELMHWSLKPDPDLPGSYYRRIEDIERAFKKLDVDNLPIAAKFLVAILVARS